MDKILETVLMSPHSRLVKQGVLRRVVESASQPLDSSQCMAIFQVSTKLFLTGNSQFKQDAGLEVLEAYAQHHKLEFEEFFNVRFVLNLLREGYGPVGKQSPLIFHYLQVGLFLVANSPSTLNLFHMVQIEILRIVCERPGPEVCEQLARLLNTCPQCAPSGNLQTVFCQQLMQTIHHFQCQSQNDDDIVTFLERVTKTSSMLQIVWRTNMATILPSLKELFVIISTPREEEDTVTSNTLASVVQYIPLELMEGTVRNLTNDKNISDVQMMTAICRMMDWLSWPFSRNIDKWIIALMKGVASVKKCVILVEVTLAKIEEVFQRLSYPIVREAALSVLSYLLLSFQQSPEAFHLVLPEIPPLIARLSAEESDSAQLCLQQLVELVHCLVVRFTGFPDIYQPVLEIIKNVAVPSEDRIKQILKQGAWTPQKPNQVALCHRLTQKSETGKTGLINLGNTCYMSSVIQALFMAPNFRHAVMAMKNCDFLPVMGELQRLFAFLQHSQRPAISPDNFLYVSTPAWFTPGSQQDCSEYLKYLLDRLHEEENKSAQMVRGRSSEGPGNESLIKKLFGGKLVTHIRCLRLEGAGPPLQSQGRVPSSPKGDRRADVPVETVSCVNNVESPHSTEEPECSSGASEDDCMHADTSFSVPDLINFFLMSEIMAGENQYHCQICGSLQNAEKVVELTRVPHYLILTLLRFSFDSVTKRRKKILDNVFIPIVLKMPVRNSSRQVESIGAGEVADTTKNSLYTSVHFDLVSVVVHSGSSSDSGHYYCYAREWSSRAAGEVSPKQEASADDSAKKPGVEDQWFLFNDTRVSYSSFGSVSNVTTHFPKDTAYMMLYQKQPTRRTEPEDQNVSAERNEGEPLVKDLIEAVRKDNKLYTQEQERGVKHRAALSPSAAQPVVWLRRTPTQDHESRSARKQKPNDDVPSI
ncbi:ubiquitin carboxyl-terminal hydrolase 35-like isoform X3 [Brienomyrus brachyistius]|uniref:ubiquitin carboxyl-terminal hydrolase 35-like isoform X3 n=1 Tax=Brienomyrus brachyistius TaxID=42636 RepID=UPI0020B1B4C8|nr:ubiquitin carboxyl-terminal hydrolase 35-like isoform X3 [Brienomyrus brachyistius]